MLAHPLITRSIEQAQKRVELQNFQARKRLLEYDDVMNQQREVIYSLRAFALEGGEELKGEALKMVERAIERRVEQSLEGYDSESDWDFGVLRQDLLMHYLLFVPEFEEGAAREARNDRGDEGEGARRGERGVRGEARVARHRTRTRCCRAVMLHVLDEKWKDHLYDLDQLRNAIHYRSWGQKDPLVEYKQEAYTMFVDLMADLYNTFAERFLRAQIVIEPPQGQSGDGDGSNGRRGPRVPAPAAPDAPLQRARHSRGRTCERWRIGGARWRRESPRANVDIGPDEAPKQRCRGAKGCSRSWARGAASTVSHRSPRETPTGRASDETIRARAAPGRSSRNATERQCSRRLSWRRFRRRRMEAMSLRRARPAI